MAYDAIIIGAGMSGLAAGIRLAMFGKRTLILERHYLPGGLNSYYHRFKRPFDVGLHAMTNFAQRGARGAPWGPGPPAKDQSHFVCLGPAQGQGFKKKAQEARRRPWAPGSVPRAPGRGPGAPGRGPRAPKGSLGIPKGPLGVPKGALGDRKGPLGDPKGTMRPNWEPKGAHVMFRW